MPTNSDSFLLYMGGEIPIAPLVDWFATLGLAVAPAGYDGPNVDPGDLILCDNAMGTNPKSVWAIYLSSGAALIIASGNEAFVYVPINCAFNSEGTLYIYENNHCTGYSRIVIVNADGITATFSSNSWAWAALQLIPSPTTFSL